MMRLQRPGLLSVILLGIAFSLAACQMVPAVEPPGSTTMGLPQNTTLPTTQPEDEIVITPTPQPTATPGVIDEVVADISHATGLNRQVFLGLTGEDWVNLGISVLIFILGYLLFTVVLHMIFRMIARSTPGERDDKFLEAITREINLIIAVLLIDFTSDRLAFIPFSWKATLDHVFFTIFVLAVTVILWKLINLSFIWQREEAERAGEVDHSASLRDLFRRFLLAIVVVFSLTILLSDYGVNITFIVAAILALAISLILAAQGILTDLIYGFILLYERSIDVGDTIEIKDLKVWGDVVEIGARTTQVRTRDNRLVVYPNSTIGRNQVVNYSFPDPSYRVQTEIGIAYGSDLDRARAIILETVRNVEGVLTDKPIEALFIAFGDSAIKIRIRWWINSFTNARPMFDRVHSALYLALGQAGIEMPYTTLDLNLQTKPGNYGSQVSEIGQDE